MIGASAVLAGVTAFGIWHIVVGGFVHGNGAAAEFGLALAALAGALLIVCLAVLRLLRD
jgi:hypothetical protein